MSVKANPVVVGGFVMGAIILIIISLLVLGSGRFFKDDLRLMAVFPGTVKGLHIGSPVLFRGVNIGSVTKIKLYHDPETRQSLVPVYIDLKQEILELINSDAENTQLTKEQELEFMVAMVKSGLHARLTMESLVSGRQLVEFEIDADIPIKLTGIDKQFLEIPTTESDINKLQNLLKSIPMTELTKSLVITVREINKLFADKDSKIIFDNINATIRESQALFENLNQQVIPLAQSTQKNLDEIGVLLNNTDTQLSGTLGEFLRLTKNLNQQLKLLTDSGTRAFVKTEQTFNNINQMVDQESITRNKLEESLNELSKAAKSFRIFTEYLERHPEALIQGKKY
ncbi:MAG: MCE family protein [gamma proteobacterium symbiont of Taylorina sp.]|nr:MCE family protein [gamma proteobacterium symbiont of Taylorina sp.]